MRILLFLILLTSYSAYSQQEEEVLFVQDSITKAELFKRALMPTKAGFYSAIVPGLGHVYQKKYWKVPVIYIALGTTTYFYIDNNNKYHKFRDLFKAKKRDENATEFSFDYLERGQKYHLRKRDLMLMSTVGVYVLQVVWASVDAHLQYHNTNSDLSIYPSYISNESIGFSCFGAGIKYRF